jgi:hypothetical protein
MPHESKFSAWIRSGGQSTFVLALNSLVDLEAKFSVAPDRLLDSIIDDALAAALSRLNQYLLSGFSIDIKSVDLTSIRDQLRVEVASRLTETGVAVDPNDPVITSINARYAEIPNGTSSPKGFALKDTSGAAGMIPGSVPRTPNTTAIFSPGPILPRAVIRAKGGTADAPQNLSLI